jgi:hypothetical protein
LLVLKQKILVGLMTILETTVIEFARDFISNLGWHWLSMLWWRIHGITRPKRDIGSLWGILVETVVGLTLTVRQIFD